MGSPPELRQTKDLISLRTRVLVGKAMDAFLSRKRKEPPATSMALPPSAELDERARHLMEKVEALAKGNGDGSDLDRCSSSSVARRSALHDPIGESLPMLVRNTESGVYIKWSLMLQDELSRIKLAYEQLKAENAFLRNRLEAAEGAPQQQQQQQRQRQHQLTLPRDRTIRWRGPRTSPHPS